MSKESIDYEITEHPTDDGGVAMELAVQGSMVARATVSGPRLAEMFGVLGFDRASVIAGVRATLSQVLRTQGQFVNISDIAENPSRPLYFNGRYHYRLGEEVSTGLVWYNVTATETGPEDVPAVVLHKMRTEVHRRLTTAGSVARSLVDLDSGS